MYTGKYISSVNNLTKCIHAEAYIFFAKQADVYLENY